MMSYLYAILAGAGIGSIIVGIIWYYIPSFTDGQF